MGRIRARTTMMIQVIGTQLISVPCGNRCRRVHGEYRMDRELRVCGDDILQDKLQHALPFVRVNGAEPGPDTLGKVDHPLLPGLAH